MPIVALENIARRPDHRPVRSVSMIAIGLVVVREPVMTNRWHFPAKPIRLA
jgi:hypothetical protein